MKLLMTSDSRGPETELDLLVIKQNEIIQLQVAESVWSLDT